MSTPTPRRRSPRRRREKGQIVPLVAIFSLLLMATMALAADLGVTTAFKRGLQNVTDAAALAGAKWLPAKPVAADEQKAALTALQVVHNSFPTTTGSWWTSSPASTTRAWGSQVSLTICDGMTSTTGCDYTQATPGAEGPFVLTVNVPPLATNIAPYLHDSTRVEVVMHQRAGTFFAGFIGQGPNQDGAQSIAHHFAPNQPFPFALFSRTIVQGGNQGETVSGNLYADRFIQPQSNGQAGICAAPDSSGNPGYIYLGYPQQDDGAAYKNDGQSSTKPLADPILDGVTCPTAKGVAGMSANPLSAAGCTAGWGGNASGSSLTYDSADGACEATPAASPPVVQKPSIPVYGGTVCGKQGQVGGIYQPGEYKCNSGATALTTDAPLKGGIYEIDPGAKSGCDLNVDGSRNLPNVTFYLKGGAIMCVTVPPNGASFSQTPYDSGSNAPGDGRFVVLSDDVGNPTINLTSGAGGSISGIWAVTGVIWLPSGTINITNKSELQDDGQVIVDTWNDTSGNHDNPSVSYNPNVAGIQNEVLQLSE